MTPIFSIYILILTFFMPTSAPTTPLKPKVFIIGLSKTGTTSLGLALTHLSYTTLGWKDILSRKLFHDFSTCHLFHLISLSTQYDAFEDIPWCFIYPEMSVLYPDSKFILSLRRDEESWWRSIKAHTERRRWVGNRWVFGSEVADEWSKGGYLERDRRHNKGVRDFFRDKGIEDRLLEVVIEEDGNWERICRFLDVECGELVEKEFPRANGKAEWGNRDVWGWYGIWDAVLGGVERVLIGLFYSWGRMRDTGCRDGL